MMVTVLLISCDEKIPDTDEMREYVENLMIERAGKVNRIMMNFLKRKYPSSSLNS